MSISCPVVLRASYYTYNIIGDVNPWFQYVGKSWICFLATELLQIIDWKKIRKFTFLKMRCYTSISRNYQPSLDNILLGSFTLSNSIILVEVEYLISWKRRFEMLLSDHYAIHIGKKNSFTIVTHPILGGSVHTGYYIYNS